MMMEASSAASSGLKFYNDGTATAIMAARTVQGLRSEPVAVVF